MITLLKKLSTDLGVELITSQEVVEGKEQLQNLQEDLECLITTLVNAKKIDKAEDITRTMAHLYKYLGEIIQDLENIQEIVTASVSRYADHFITDEKV